MSKDALTKDKLGGKDKLSKDALTKDKFGRAKTSCRRTRWTTKTSSAKDKLGKGELAKDKLGGKDKLARR